MFNERRALAAIACAVMFAQGAAGAQLDVPGAYPTIQAAIAAASDGDVVRIAPGTYAEALDLQGKSLTLRGGGAGATTLDGTGLGAPILSASAGETAVLEALTFTGGEGRFASNCINSNVSGGAVLFTAGGSLTLRDCVLHRNGHAVRVAVGAAVYMHMGGAVRAERCVFSENGAGGGAGRTAYGGAIAACVTGTDTVQLIDCTFTGNTASHGGAVFVRSPEDLPGGSTTVTECTFSGNSASHGAGLNDASAALAVSVSSFAGNAASGGGGGIIRLGFYGTTSIAACTFTGNTAAHGGGANLQSASTASVEDCAFVDNTASHGGGLRATNEATLAVRRCTFTGGEAAFGAGINVSTTVYDPANLGDVTIEGCSFTGNTSAMGGGLLAQVNASPGLPAPSLRLVNSRFTENTATMCCQVGNLQSACFLDGYTPGTFYGGGADIREGGGGSVVVAGCLFAGNTGAHAGGLHVATCGGPLVGDGPAGTVRISNVTAVGNAPDGVHVRVAAKGDVDVASSIVRGNTAGQIVTSVANPSPGATSIDVVRSNVQGGHAGPGNIDADPLFTDAPGGDYRLGAGSPCIDAGDNPGVPAGVTTDLAGSPRFVDDPGAADTGAGTAPIVDMGAFERSAPAPVVCCRGCTCSVLPAAGCSVAPGSQAGAAPLAATTCNAPGNTSAPCCVADYNKVGNVELLDIFAFLNDWFGNRPYADFNGQNNVDLLDIFGFLGAWFAGPCG